MYFPTICNVVFHPVPVPHRNTSEIKALALSVYYKNDYLKLAHSAVYLHKDSCVMTWQNRLVIQPSERVIDWPALTPNQTLTCWICNNLSGLKEVLGCVWEPEEREKQSRRKEALKRAKKIPAARCKVEPLSLFVSLFTGLRIVQSFWTHTCTHPLSPGFYCLDWFMCSAYNSSEARNRDRAYLMYC